MSATNAALQSVLAQASRISEFGRWARAVSKRSACAPMNCPHAQG
jgi:hypothetical protein